MYRYDEFDTAFVQERVADFTDQVNRRLSGALTEDEFKPLRLRNGLYLQLHAYMLRVAIPYGTLNSSQLRQLAMISQKWDKGYGHFTTRQNIQFNWPALQAVPEMLNSLAEVGMHAIQTSGNCIRNVTSDHFAGAAQDETTDPRPVAELIRQWSTDHPEFAYLPRKFKFAVTGSPVDRAVTRAHDIGIRLLSDQQCEVSVGGGLGRTPVVGKVVNGQLPIDQLLPYLEAIMRVYNLYGRRDNKYKARIKILLNDLGVDAFRSLVDEAYHQILEQEKEDRVGVSAGEWARIARYFAPPAWAVNLSDGNHLARLKDDTQYRQWCNNNLTAHKAPQHYIATVSLKGIGEIPGDATAQQMRVVADLAAQYAYDEIRVSHQQNLILPHVPVSALPAIYDGLAGAGLASANAGMVTDIIACPGMDYCSLATARSIPVAQDISSHFGQGTYADTLGKVSIKISGCINACGHHHVGNIGILGLDKGGRENYQFTLGGDPSSEMKLGERAGPGVDADEVVPALQRVFSVYLDERANSDESFLETCKRIGNEPFKRAIYQTAPKDTRSATV
jgi:sulfite reductase (NADPH) hemoprotein beta-component